MEPQKTEIAVLGGGCFWCTEAVFKMFGGVVSVASGYAGGTVENPTYEQVCTGNTGHAEVLRIEYDPTIVSFNTLLVIFFASHDATTYNRQGNDVGTQYRSVIFYTSPLQMDEAAQFIKDLNSMKVGGDAIVTELAPLEEFYFAEEYHQNYYARNGDNTYCQIVINPKLEKVQEKFAQLLKEQHSGPRSI